MPFLSHCFTIVLVNTINGNIKQASVGKIYERHDGTPIVLYITSGPLQFYLLDLESGILRESNGTISDWECKDIEGVRGYSKRWTNKP